MRQLTSRLSTRLASRAMLAALLLGLLLSAVQIALDLYSQRGVIERSVGQIHDLSHNAAQRAVYLYDDALALEVIDGVAGHSYVLQTQIIDDHGYVMARFQRTMPNSPTRWLTALLSTQQREFRFPLYSDQPSATGGQAAPRLDGYFVIQVDIDQLLSPFYKRALYILTAGVLRNVLLAAVLVVLFHRLLTRPIQQIDAALQAIDPNSPKGQRVPSLPQNDELGHLCRMINTYLAQAEQHHGILQAKHQALAEAEEQTRVIVNTMPQMIFMRDELHRITFLNQATAQFYQTATEQLQYLDHRRLHEPLNAEQSKQMAAWHEQVLKSQQPLYLSDLQLTDPKGKHHDFRATVLPLPHHGNQYTLTVAMDVSEQMAAERQIFSLAYFDVLTGRPNRHRFRQLLETLLSRLARQGQYGCLYLLDVDDFVRINDVFGHTMGDTLLRKIDERLGAITTDQDIIGRLGGDEFALARISPMDTGQEAQLDAQAFAEQIEAALEQPFLIERHQVHMSISLGMVMFPEPGLKVEDLLRFADTALYQAKREGKHRIKQFTQAMADDSAAKMNLELEIHHAIEKRQFEYYLQPQIASDSGRCVGAEAIMRWQHPAKGCIKPDHFIPYLEHSGLIVPVAKQLFEQLCQWIQQHHDSQFFREGGRISVNVCPYQFFQLDWEEQVLATILHYQLPTSAIEFEITESTAMHDLQEAHQRISDLKAQGFGFSLDDFGSGYSSLSHLKQLPVDTVKIDRQFIHDLGSNDSAEAVLDAILGIARAMHLTVVAEGVETAAQQALLSAKLVDRLQGFKLASPMPLAEFEANYLNPPPLRQQSVK